MSDFSIIIPSYNTKQLLVDCINSIYKETKTPLEIIVVDNASTDGTVENLKSQISNLKSTSQILKLIENKQNFGFARAVNQGLKKAQGRYILILNSDTVILDQAIDKEINFLETHQEVGVVGCQIKNPDGSLQASGGYIPNLFKVFFWMSFIDDLPILNKILKPYHVEDLEFYQHQHYLGWISGAFLMTKKEVVKKVGYFDENIFMYVEEVDWCARMIKAGFRVAFDPQASIVHHRGASAKSKQSAIIEEFQGLKYFFQKYYPLCSLPLLRLCFKFGALARAFLFAIIAKDPQKQQTYAEVFKLA